MEVAIPGWGTLKASYLVLDFNGTIARDGEIPLSVQKLLQDLATEFQIYILTADTHGTARKKVEGLPVAIQTFPSDAAAREKKKIVCALGKEHCIAMGNGRNDVEMLRECALSIGVLDQEGMYGPLLNQADIVVRSMEEGLSLLQNKNRLIATLRG